MKARNILTLILMLGCFFSMAQKKYGNVYYSLKSGNNWGGLIKTDFAAQLKETDIDGVYTLSLVNKAGYVSSSFASKFETTSSDGRAFHTLVKQPGHIWQGPMHEHGMEITWIYFNKSVELIFQADLKPFDFELQFEDGSGVKYFLSPAY